MKRLAQSDEGLKTLRGRPWCSVADLRRRRSTLSPLICHLRGHGGAPCYLALRWPGTFRDRRHNYGEGYSVVLLAMYSPRLQGHLLWKFRAAESVHHRADSPPCRGLRVHRRAVPAPLPGGSAKVVEFQARGIIHGHAPIRLDGQRSAVDGPPATLEGGHPAGQAPSPHEQ